MPEELDEHYNHYLDCYKRCLLVESSFDSLENATGHSYFPAIIGRRPVSPLGETSCLQEKENIQHVTPSLPTV